MNCHKQAQRIFSPILWTCSSEMVCRISFPQWRKQHAPKVWQLLTAFVFCFWPPSSFHALLSAFPVVIIIPFPPLFDSYCCFVKGKWKPDAFFWLHDNTSNYGPESTVVSMSFWDPEQNWIYICFVFFQEAILCFSSGCCSCIVCGCTFLVVCRIFPHYGVISPYLFTWRINCFFFSFFYVFVVIVVIIILPAHWIIDLVCAKYNSLGGHVDSGRHVDFEPPD